jgi:hypothetical protein
MARVRWAGREFHAHFPSRRLAASHCRTQEGAAPKARLSAFEPKAERREDQVAPDPVFDGELVKRPGAEVDLLGARLERVAEHRPDRRHPPPESAELVARTVVIRHLLNEVAADTRGKAEGQVLIDRPFKWSSSPL